VLRQGFICNYYLQNEKVTGILLALVEINIGRNK